MYKYLFGPVPSRRLGTSLGIDLTPDKSCSFNCVYCECGKTDILTVERREFVPTEAVLDELRAFLAVRPMLDSITFSGSGEPTLHTGIGRIIAMLKSEFPAYRVTVLTNSSLLHMPEVRTDLMSADRVVPSLDAVSEEVFRQINRPHRSLESAGLIEGLRTFCREFQNELWLEVFVVPGINDTPEELHRFKEVIATLRVDRIQLNSLDRPGAVDWITPTSFQRLTEIAAFLGGPVDIVASRRRISAEQPTPVHLKERILSTIRIRPCTLVDLHDIFHLSTDELRELLTQLISDDLVECRRENRGIFYRVKSEKQGV
jgi:wyosine [tRNA(Phe)-imidazoG37] synthetase (radical SAM superfamily)